MRLFRFFILVDLQARMHLRAEASRLYLSYLWWVIEPMLFVSIFYLVWEVMFESGRGDFLLFLICGKIPFLWFSKSVTSASDSIVKSRGLISQLDMPKPMFPYVAIQKALYKQWAVFLVLFGGVMMYGRMPELNWLRLLPLIVVQYGLIVLCSLIGAFLVSFFVDFMMLISLGMLFMMFGSGVFWDVNLIQNVPLRDLVLTWNPLAFLLDAYRKVLMDQGSYDMVHLGYLGWIILAGIALLHVLYFKTNRIIAARVIHS